MAEQEFELYLSLLSKFLRLKPEQRAEIADELRDHLEARLAELAAAGHSPAEAIKLALDELGDAAGLAKEFTQITAVRRQRFIMKCTLGSIAALTVAILLTAALWPAQHNAGGNQVVAQSPPVTAPPADVLPPGALPGAAQAPAVAWRAEVEGKLAKRVSVEFQETPLSDALIELGKQLKLNIVIDRHYCEDGIALAQPIQLMIDNTATGRTVLELILDTAGPGKLGYAFRDGLIYITGPEGSYEVQVYNCRDLLAEGVPAAGGAGAGAPMTAGSSLGGAFGHASLNATSHAGRALVVTIQETIQPDSWRNNGGSASIGEFNGLLVVKQTQSVHRELKQLLEKLRSANTARDDR